MWNNKYLNYFQIHLRFFLFKIVGKIITTKKQLNTKKAFFSSPLTNEQFHVTNEDDGDMDSYR